MGAACNWKQSRLTDIERVAAGCQDVVAAGYQHSGGSRIFEGGGIKRHRREDRGAVGAEQGGMWGGGVPLPLPTGGKVWEGGCSPSPENFWTFYLEIALFGAF